MNDITRLLDELSPGSGDEIIDVCAAARAEIERLRDIITLAYLELVPYTNHIRDERAKRVRAEQVLDLACANWKYPDDVQGLREKLNINLTGGMSENGDELCEDEGCIHHGTPHVCNSMPPESSSNDVALCQDGCGIIPVTDLVPDENDPPGRCPHCNGQTCQCDACVGDHRSPRSDTDD